VPPLHNFQNPGWQASVTDACIEKITISGGEAVGKARRRRRTRSSLKSLSSPPCASAFAGSPRPDMRTGVRSRGLLLLGLAAGAIAAACQDFESDVVLVGTVERTLVEISAPAPELLVGVSVVHGDHVAVRDVVARLDDTLARADLAAAEAALAGTQARSVVTEAELSRAHRLEREGVASRQALDRARAERDQATALLREAQARLDATRKRLADLTVVAPVAGVVDQIPFDPGERVPAGAVLAVLLADGPPWVRVWLPERALANVAPGQQAEVRIDGVPGPQTGRVLDVGREPEFTPHLALTERERGHLVYETRVLLEGDALARLRPGVPATVTFRLASSRLEAGR